ncbi:MAG: K(+)-transporting ATPase subunit C [Chryseolinea sp.]
MKTHIFPAIKLTVFSILFFSGIYTGIVWLMAQASPNHGKGELVEANGKVVGYARIGQSFTDDKYFQSRPSMVDYNAAGSGGSNKGASNEDHLAIVQARIDSFLVHNPTIKKEQIPVELITASASGLDPHLFPASAKIQIDRIARIRNINRDKLDALVDQYTEGPLMGILGPEKTDVLQLNIALDDLK